MLYFDSQNRKFAVRIWLALLKISTEQLQPTRNF